jgi:hypothetical protein
MSACGLLIYASYPKDASTFFKKVAGRVFLVAKRAKAIG